MQNETIFSLGPKYVWVPYLHIHALHFGGSPFLFYRARTGRHIVGIRLLCIPVCAQGYKMKLTIVVPEMGPNSLQN